jgi:aldose 1-epimerase
MKKSLFGSMDNGREAHLFTLSNSQGMQVVITDFGATIVAINVPDRHGKLANVVLGYDSLEAYRTGHFFLGATIGRFGNRIAGGQFSLNGTQFSLPKNNGENHLHGGSKGFHTVLWSAEDISSNARSALRLSYLSKDGEEGYPGNLSVTVTFTLTENNHLEIEYRASTDKDTVVNLTNHSYFNLAGCGNILGHHLKLLASRFTPVNSGLIPTGELRPVRGTPFDFLEPSVIGSRIHLSDEQLQRGKGYDHNWILDNVSAGTLTPAASVSEPTTGRILEVWTTEPAIQFYSGNFLEATPSGNSGANCEFRSGFCLETQHYPDSPNHPEFPSTTVRPGAEFRSSTVFKFLTS